MHDDLGRRMKSQYEHRTRIFLPRRTYTVVRVDGKAFHTYTRSFSKPFDDDLIQTMDNTAKRLCENIQGAKFAYVQSDEISILLTDFEKITTDAWFDGNIQKIASISAAMATAYFNDEISKIAGITNPALFDARVFTIPDPIEVENYFIWRQNDATRNSIQMVARAFYSHKECNNKNTSQLQDMIHDKGINWNDYPPSRKRGRIVIKGEDRGWLLAPPPIFTQDRDFLRSRIPTIGVEDAE